MIAKWPQKLTLRWIGVMWFDFEKKNITLEWNICIKLVKTGAPYRLSEFQLFNKVWLMEMVAVYRVSRKLRSRIHIRFYALALWQDSPYKFGFFISTSLCLFPVHLAKSTHNDINSSFLSSSRTLGASLRFVFLHSAISVSCISDGTKYHQQTLAVLSF